MNKIIKCILLDLDGTLLNSGPDLLLALNYVLKKQNLKTINKNTIGSLVGGGAKAMIERAYNFLNKKIPSNRMETLIDCFLEFYIKNCSNSSHLYPNVENTIKALKSKFKIALCTNKKQEISEKILKEFNIIKFFDLILGSSNKLKLKPSTEMLEFCLKKLQVEPKQSIMIGDSINDMIPAQKIGVETIFVNYGYGKLDDSIKPSYEVNSFEEILQIPSIKF